MNKDQIINSENIQEVKKTSSNSRKKYSDEEAKQRIRASQRKHFHRKKAMDPEWYEKKKAYYRKYQQQHKKPAKDPSEYKTRGRKSSRTAEEKLQNIIELQRKASAAYYQRNKVQKLEKAKNIYIEKKMQEFVANLFKSE